MILTEEVMKQLDNTEVRVDQVTTSFINYQGAHQMTVDTYVNGKFDFDESQCYDEGDEALPEHLDMFKRILKARSELVE